MPRMQESNSRRICDVDERRKRKHGSCPSGLFILRL
nr:MAG TPA: hypothetical protein [Caudoviricetes sp.]